MHAMKLAPLVCLVFASRLLAGEINLSDLDDAPRISSTKLGIHGDPVNVALVGTKEELIAAMVAAKWQPADPITFKSSVKLVKSVVLHRPDDKAPVSNLYLWKRKEDLAFEQQVGRDAARRHHVRFWESKRQIGGRPLWLGSATFDTKVGFSHTTGMITHHIDADIDADRDKLLKDLAAGLDSSQAIDGFQVKCEGRNGGGDPYHTDGKLSIGVLKSGR
jgi:hypothetical protein